MILFGCICGMGCCCGCSICGGGWEALIEASRNRQGILGGNGSTAEPQELSFLLLESFLIVNPLRQEDGPSKHLIHLRLAPPIIGVVPRVVGMRVAIGLLLLLLYHRQGKGKVHRPATSSKQRSAGGSHGTGRTAGTTEQTPAGFLSLMVLSQKQTIESVTAAVDIAFFFSMPAATATDNALGCCICCCCRICCCCCIDDGCVDGCVDAGSCCCCCIGKDSSRGR